MMPPCPQCQVKRLNWLWRKMTAAFWVSAACGLIWYTNFFRSLPGDMVLAVGARHSRQESIELSRMDQENCPDLGYFWLMSDHTFIVVGYDVIFFCCVLVLHRGREDPG